MATNGKLCHILVLGSVQRILFSKSWSMNFLQSPHWEFNHLENKHSFWPPLLRRDRPAAPLVLLLLLFGWWQFVFQKNTSPKKE